MTVYRFSYHFPDEQMYLSHLFASKEELPACIQEIDKKEAEALAQENEILRNAAKFKITAVKVCAAVLGAGLGVLAAMLAASLLPISAAFVDSFAYGGLFIGSIVGYLIGAAMDRAGASSRLAAFTGRICEKRIARLTEKLEQLKKAAFDEKEKPAVDKAKEWLEKVVQQSAGYSRVKEFIGI
jgi:hypothetical protein